MLEQLAVFAFVFVTLSVAGWRMLDQWDRMAKAPRKPRGTAYTGPLYTIHGREIAK